MLEGATIYGAVDDKVGKIDHVHGTGSVIIDVGGFLGMGAKAVSVPLGNFSFMRDGKGEVHGVTTWTQGNA